MIKIGDRVFTRVTPDSFGYWCVEFNRNGRRFMDRISDFKFNLINRSTRRPVGDELIHAVEGIIKGRLTNKQKEEFLKIECVG